MNDVDFYSPVVSKLSQSGEEELLTMKQKVQILADETAHSLKKNVYKNYSQFIETAKEISSRILYHDFCWVCFFKILWIDNAK